MLFALIACGLLPLVGRSPGTLPAARVSACDTWANDTITLEVKKAGRGPLFSMEDKMSEFQRIGRAYRTYALGTARSPGIPNVVMIVPDVEPLANHVVVLPRNTAASILPSPS